MYRRNNEIGASILVTAGRPRGKGTLRLGKWATNCAIGHAGLRAHKREGDGATPVGKFPLRRVYYRRDRIARPACRLPVTAITSRMGWSDDPLSPDYNRLVTLPNPGSAERLWREDNQYDLILVIGHNDTPVRTNYGSAIFVHVARRGLTPTQGCVALTQSSLLRVLAHVGPLSSLVILPPSRPSPQAAN